MRTSSHSTRRPPSAATQHTARLDTKKKVLVGEFKNGGREWARKGTPVEVNTHDFPSHARGKATPYGVYDVGRNEGWVSVGVNADIAAFAVNAIGTWWGHLGHARYSDEQIRTITADSAVPTALAAVNVERHSFHSDWNYTVYPPDRNRAVIKS